VVAVVAVREGDELMLITQQGMVTRMRVDEIRIVGRNTQGVRLINLREEDKVVTAAKIAREDVAETEELPAVDLPPTTPSAPEAEEE
jgi:DNA gyrase subunit A